MLGAEIEDQLHLLGVGIPFHLGRKAAGFAKDLSVKIHRPGLDVAPAVREVGGELSMHGDAVVVGIDLDIEKVEGEDRIRNTTIVFDRTGGGSVATRGFGAGSGRGAGGT